MNEDKQILQKLYRYGVAARFFAGFAGWLLMLFTDLQLVQDAATYDEVGASIADDWLNGKQSEWLLLHGDEAHQPWLMVTALGCFYFLMLGVRALPVVLLAFATFTAFASRYTYLIARELGSEPREAALGAWIVAISPAFVFWAGALYKEGIILVVLNCAVYHLILLQRSWKLRSLVIVVGCIVALSGLRLYLAAIVSVTLTAGLALARQREKESSLRSDSDTSHHVHEAKGVMDSEGNRRLARKTSNAVILTAARQVMIAVLFIAVLVGVGFTDAVQRILPEDLQSGVEQIHISRADLASADSGYLREADISTVEGAAAFLPFGVAYFLAVPLPWHIGSLRQNIAIPDTAFWICLYPVVAIGMYDVLRSRYQATILIIVMTVAMCCFYALFIGNVGTAYRMRVQVWILWAPFVGLGWTKVSAWFSRRRNGARRSTRVVVG